jgi:hypothetical protein
MDREYIIYCLQTRYGADSTYLFQVSYLREVRGGGVDSGYVATGFWGGKADDLLLRGREESLTQPSLHAQV